MKASFFPSIYNDIEAELTKQSIQQYEPFGGALFHENGRKLIPWFRQRYPGKFVMARRYCDPQTEDYLNNPEWGGKDHAQLSYSQASDADAYIGLCEPGCQSLYDAERIARFDAEFADECARLNKIALIGGFASGGPEEDVIDHYFSKFFEYRKIKKNNAVFNFHAYGPNLRLYVNPDGSPGAPNDLMMSAVRDNSLRFKLRWLPLLAKYNIYWIITEAGPSGYLQSTSALGWKGVHSPEVVAADSIEWILQARTVDRLLGATGYCLDDSGGWDGFNENGSVIPSIRGDFNKQNFDNTSWKTLITSGGVAPVPDYVGLGTGILNKAKELGWAKTGIQLSAKEIYLKDGQGKDTYSYCVFDNCEIRYYPDISIVEKRVKVIPFDTFPN